MEILLSHIRWFFNILKIIKRQFTVAVVNDCINFVTRIRDPMNSFSTLEYSKILQGTNPSHNTHTLTYIQILTIVEQYNVIES